MVGRPIFGLCSHLLNEADGEGKKRKHSSTSASMLDRGEVVMEFLLLFAKFSVERVEEMVSR